MKKNSGKKVMAAPAQRVIILAAGSGTRLRPYTDDRPKCLFELGGATLLGWQMSALRECGLNDITIVTGYRSEQFDGLDVKTVHNPEWQDTNMVASLGCASKVLSDDIIVSYADIIYEPYVVQRLLDSDSDISVVVDKGFRSYWEMRFKDPLSDLESLAMTPEGHIKSIGKKVSSLDEIQAQYVGLMRFKRKGVSQLKSAIAENKASGRYARMFMTDLFQYMADRGDNLKAVPIYHGWLEIDNTRDYEVLKQRFNDKTIREFFNPQSTRK